MISLTLFLALMIGGIYLHRKADKFTPSIIHTFMAISGFFGVVISVIILFVEFFIKNTG